MNRYPTIRDLEALWDACVVWIEQEKPSRPEAIYQNEAVQEGLPDLAERVCDVVGYYD